jgi:hypothetical protein
MSKPNHHREGQANSHQAHTPYWMRVHHDWRFWVAAILMFGAMIIYLMSDDLAWRPWVRTPAPITNPVGS